MPESPDPDRKPSPPELTRAALRPLTVLGLDMGAARIGVAVKPATQSMVLPLEVVSARPEAHAHGRIRQLIHERDARIVVVGLPVHADPTQANRIRKDLRRLRKGVRGVRWRFHDETLTSSAAADIGRALGEGPGAPPDDDRAAALILEDYLQSIPAA